MWLDKPPPDQKPEQILLLRAKAGGSIEAELTGEPLRCFVHFAVEKSWPCTGHKCFLCGKQIGKRCYAYYPVRGSEGGHAILELTAQSEASLINQMSPVTQVPRGTIKVSRPSGKRNNPCSVQWKDLNNIKETGGGAGLFNKKTGGGIETKTKQTAGGSLTENEMKTALMRIWKLPSQSREVDDHEYLEIINEAIRLQCNQRAAK